MSVLDTVPPLFISSGSFFKLTIPGREEVPMSPLALMPCLSPWPVWWNVILHAVRARSHLTQGLKVCSSFTFTAHPLDGTQPLVELQDLVTAFSNKLCFGIGKTEHESACARKDIWEEFVSAKHRNHILCSTSLALFCWNIYISGLDTKNTNFCTVVIYTHMKFDIKWHSGTCDGQDRRERRISPTVCSWPVQGGNTRILPWPLSGAKGGHR